MLIRSLFFGLLLLCAPSFADAACSTATPPTWASAEGLTFLAFCSDFSDNLADIDTTDTMDPDTCTGAVNVPVAKCHWFVNNAWPQTAIFVCSGNALSIPGCFDVLPTAKTVDYSIVGGALLLQPYILTTTGNNTSGSTTITNLASTANLNADSGVVTGTGVQPGTTFSLSGTTATLDQPTTAGSTGGSYSFGNVYNGSEMNTCASSSGGQGYVGNAFQGNMAIVASITSVANTNPLYSSNESWPNIWMLPMEVQTAGRVSTGVRGVEFDIAEMPAPTGSDGGDTSVHDEYFDNTGELYWSQNPVPGGIPALYTMSIAKYGGTPAGTLIMTPRSGAGGAANVGLVGHAQANNLYETATFGPTTVNGALGSYTTSENLHYCIMIDAAPHWPLTINEIDVWQAPPVGGAQIGGRRSPFR